MLAKTITALSCAALGAIASAGCLVVHEAPVQDAGYGTLAVDWTLDGSASPAACEYYGVDRVDIALYDMSDRFVTAIQPYCEDFYVVLYDVPDERYYLDITLLDWRGAAISDTLSQTVTVWDGEETAVYVDFSPAFIY